MGQTKIILDNSVLIDKNFGTNRQKEYIIAKIPPQSRLYITKITLGEFIRSVLRSSLKLLNTIILRISEIQNYESIEIFLDNCEIDLPSYSPNERDRISKINLYLKKIIIKAHSKALIFDLPFEVILQSFIDDILNFKHQFLKNIEILDFSYSCLDAINEVFYNTVKNHYTLKKKITCKGCEVKSLQYFSQKYKSEIIIIAKAIQDLKIIVNSSFNEAIKILINWKKTLLIDGRKHYCYKLADLFVILESPSDFLIFTTNIKHFEPIARLMGKSLL